MRTQRPTLRPARATMLAAALLAAAWLATPAQAQDGDVLATLDAAQTSFASGDAIVVRLTLTNSGSEPVGLLRWLTPEDGIAGPIFAVERDGALVPYTGIRVKRAAPTEADYVFLDAGASVTWDVDLTDAYDFSVTGTYGVTYDVASNDLFVPGADATAFLTSDTLEVLVAGHPRPAAQLLPKTEGASTSFVGCTTTRQTALSSARTNAVTYSTDGLGYLGAGIVDAHYTTWFGVWDATRYATVEAHFTSILALLSGGAMIFDCTCTDSGTYAFVYPDDATHTVTLCGAFWSAPATGTDSKAGTLIHETSHFLDVASTDDFVYGQAGAKSLASSNPARAIANADNHEYFGESSLPFATPAPTPSRTPTPSRSPTPTPSRTPTPTPTRTPAPTARPNGFVPPDAGTASCEAGIARRLGRLSTCTRKCHLMQVGAVLQGLSFDEDACEEGTPTSCRGTFDAASAALAGCPACLDATGQASVADRVMAFVDQSNGAVYCDGTVSFGGDDTGFVPRSADAASCQGSVARALKRYAACLVKCDRKQANALAGGSSFDVDACKRTRPRSCRAVYDAASASAGSSGLCPACLGASARSAAANALTSFVAGLKSSIYCEGTVPLP